MDNFQLPKQGLGANIAEKYRSQGFNVIPEPPKSLIPFDLGNYHPDLIEIEPIQPSATLVNYLAESLPFASAASEKARSERIICPVLLEVRRILNRQISIFSGEDFTVDESVGLNGMCDFLLSRSAEVLEIEAPAIIIIEAKKGDLRNGFGQCIAEMVAAQRFNAAKGRSVGTIYGSISSGTQWRFLKLVGDTITLDLTDYPLPPVDQVLSMLVWMAQDI